MNAFETASRAGGAEATASRTALDTAGIVVSPDLTQPAAKQPTAIPAPRGRRNRLARFLVRRLATGSVGRRFMLSALDDPRATSWLLHRLSNKGAAGATFDDNLLSDTPVRGFEDCFWLFSSNPLNHGLARLEFDEAAYLFRLVRSLGEPLAAEIGRFRGGTTFLLAAAGAHVVSVDNDLSRQRTYSLELAAALSRHGLRERVEIVIADSRSYPVDLGPFELVFVDGDHSYAGVQADFEHWWPALADGGHLVFHDAAFAKTDSRLRTCEGVVRFVAELDARDVAERRAAPGTLAHFVKRPS